MTPERRRLALRAMGRALKLRQQNGIAPDQPCCVYDLAERIGVEVRFADIPSAEGIYSPGKPVIVVSSLRPSGRQSFTCAHELGHHIYGHGERFDELIEERGANRRYDPKEFEADCFGAALLLPKTAVLKGLAARRFNPKTLTPEQAYIISSWLGVGYTTLVGNMGRNMDLLGKDQTTALEKMKLPLIRKSLLGMECKDHLVIVDEAWSYPTIGDFLAYQYVTDLNYSTLINFSEMDFVVPGPGAKSGISKCFESLGGISEEDIIRVVTDRQSAEFERLGIDFKSLWGRPLQLIDCQNLFCEVDKYSRVFHPDITGGSQRTRIKQKFRSNSGPIEYWFPPKWELNDKIKPARKEAAR